MARFNFSNMVIWLIIIGIIALFIWPTIGSIIFKNPIILAFGFFAILIIAMGGKKK